MKPPNTLRELEEFYDYNRPKPENTKFPEKVGFIGALLIITGICLITWFLIH